MSSDPESQPTCGHGLAANAALPARFGELFAATAEVLERHIRALDPDDPASAPEREAYDVLARSHRALAGMAADLARRMESFRDLPMARHDVTAMVGPGSQAEAFAHVVALERALLAFLAEKVAADESLAGGS